jgi:hypothetical protein
MPITITPAPPAGIVGPGVPLQLFSDFIGPIPTDGFWDITITSIPGELIVWNERKAFFPGNRTYWLGNGQQVSDVLENQTSPQAGEQVAINVGLNDTTGIVDTGSVTATWEPTLGLGFQVATTPRATGGISTDPRIDQILAAVVHQIVPQG